MEAATVGTTMAAATAARAGKNVTAKPMGLATTAVTVVTTAVQHEQQQF